MTLVWTRIDQKLIHGQVSVAWVPHLEAEAIVVVDHNTMEDLWAQKVMMMGLPPEVRLTRFTCPAQLGDVLAEEEMSSKRVMVIFKDLPGFLESVESGSRFDRLNLGNQAPEGSGCCIGLTDAFYASQPDLEALELLRRQGLEVTIQAVPSSKAVKWKP